MTASPDMGRRELLIGLAVTAAIGTGVDRIIPSSLQFLPVYAKAVCGGTHDRTQ